MLLTDQEEENLEENDEEDGEEDDPQCASGQKQLRKSLIRHKYNMCSPPGPTASLAAKRPRGKTVNDSERATIIALKNAPLKAGQVLFTNQQIADIVGVTARTVQKVAKSYKQTGSAHAPPRKPVGRKKLINSDELAVRLPLSPSCLPCFFVSKILDVFFPCRLCIPSSRLTAPSI